MAKKKEAARIVIRRVSESGHGKHHGGAWKVAYADFVTAMMAFFLMMWLLGTTSQERLEGLAGYFTDPSSTEANNVRGGDAGILSGAVLAPPSFIQQPPASPFDMSPTPPHGEETESELTDSVVEAFGSVGEAVAENMRVDQELERGSTREDRRFDKVQEQIAQALAAKADLADLRQQLEVTRVEGGLRIELLDRENVAMFPLGSDRLSPAALRLLAVVEKAVADTPNRLSIRGHTDSQPYAASAWNDNWRLSADRANATRVALTQMGLPERRVADVVGKADTEPRLPANPADPSNRRISILLMAVPRHAVSPSRLIGQTVAPQPAAEPM